MKRFVISVVLLSLLSPAIFAQEKVVSTSPCVNLTATPSVFSFDEIVVITASSPNNSISAYRWEIKGGEIIKGQDTNSVEIRAHLAGVLTATVKAGNGETVCAHSISLDVIGCGLPREIDRYGKLPLEAEKARLDNVAASFAEETASIMRILILAQFGAKVSKTSATSRLARAKKYLTGQHKIDSSKVLLFLSEDKYSDAIDNSTAIYIMPEDAPFPSADYKLITDDEISTPSKKVSQTKRKKN
jgi:hypothetical protein